MATVCAHGSFIPFDLPLEGDGCVVVLEDLLDLRFNLYIKQEMYFAGGELSRIILMQKNRNEDGSMWILGPKLFRVMSLCDFQMQASTVILTNEYGTSSVQIPSVAIVKLEPTDDSVLVLSDSKDDICIVVDISDTSPFPFRSRDSTPSKLHMQLPKFPYNSLYMRVAHHGAISQCPPLHHFSSLLGMIIVDALK